MRRRRRRHRRRACGATRPGRAGSATSSAGSSSTASRRSTTRPRPSAASTCTSTSPSSPPGRPVGEHGLVALDWHSGNRSVLVDHELSGLVVGQTLATRPEDTYRALLEATAFGTRTIIEAFVDAGVPVTELVVAGGLLKNPLLMQIYADVHQPAAVHDRLRAGPGARLGDPRRGRRRRLPRRARGRRRRWAGRDRGVYQPIPANVEAYDALFAEYTLLHDYFGRGANDVMHRLRAMRRAADRRRRARDVTDTTAQP